MWKISILLFISPFVVDSTFDNIHDYQTTFDTSMQVGTKFNPETMETIESKTPTADTAKIISKKPISRSLYSNENTPNVPAMRSNSTYVKNVNYKNKKSRSLPPETTTVRDSFMNINKSCSEFSVPKYLLCKLVLLL